MPGRGSSLLYQGEKENNINIIIIIIIIIIINLKN